MSVGRAAMKAIQIEAFGAGEVALALEASPIKELYDKMLGLYPDRTNPGSPWASARAVNRWSVSLVR
jgi:hypothetical protein